MAIHQRDNLRSNIDCEALNIIGGSREFFFLSLYAINADAVPTEPLDLSNVSEMEWLCAPFSVVREKGVAIAHKTLTSGDINIIRDGSDGNPNLIQVIIEPHDTINLHGAFLHQFGITDGAGDHFVPFEGIINVNRRIRTA